MDASAKTSPSTPSKYPHPAALVWCILLVLGACTVATAFRTRDCFVDDAFTGFQYIQNLLAGHGFTFHSQEKPVEGVTNIGWLLTLAPFCTIADVLTVAKLAGLTLVLLNLLLAACLGWCLAVRIVRQEEASSLMLPPVLMLAASFEFVYFPLAGMETGLLATLLLLSALVALHRPNSLWLPVLAAYAFTVHPEAVAVYPVYFLAERNNKNYRPIILFAALIGAITALRFAYFHELVPNTFHSKPGGFGPAMENAYAFLMAKNPNVAFPVTGWLALPVLVLGYLALRLKAASAANMLAAICIVGLGFAIYSPADWTSTPRYFAPYLPAAILLIWVGVFQSLRLLAFVGLSARLTQFTAAAVALLLALTAIVDSQNKLNRFEEFPGYVMTAKNLIEPAEWIRDNLPPNSTIATRRIGALAYFSGQKVFDYCYGLPNLEVSRLVGRRGHYFNLPTEAELEPIWKERKPDYILEDSLIVEATALRSGGTRDNFSIHGIPYRSLKRFPIGRDAEWVLAERIIL